MPHCKKGLVISKTKETVMAAKPAQYKEEMKIEKDNQKKLTDMKSDKK
jgi:hypothetical protein